MTPEQLRLLVKTQCKKEITSEQAKQVLDVFAQDLEDHLNNARREFVIKHFGY